ncbi:hypothetical protein ACSBR1_038166 [Camellia fascicularis]
MATHKVMSIIFFVLLGLGICSATRALLTLEGGSYTPGSGGTANYGAGHGIGGGGGGGGGGSGGGGHGGYVP